MSRLSIPVSSKLLYSTGDLRLWVDIILQVKTRAKVFIPQRFRVDSATDLTTFPAVTASSLDLIMPGQPARSAKHKQTGLVIRSGLLCFRVEGMDATEYAVPCLFLGDPDGPPTPQAKPLLQPLALLAHLTFTMQKDANCLFPHGELIVENR